jgi:hypothetical protein
MREAISMHSERSSGRLRVVVKKDELTCGYR